MKELNYKYQVIEEKTVGEKTFYKVKDAFENNILFVEKYKEAKDMDWDESSKLEKELEDLKSNNEINDFFYSSDYTSNTKIFYKVFNELDNFPFDLPEINEVAVNVTNKEENSIENEQAPIKTEEQIYKIETPEESPTLSNHSIVEKTKLEKRKERKKTNKSVTLNEVITTNSSGLTPENKLNNEIKTYNLEELGGKVKVNVEEDIFNAPLIPNEETADFETPINQSTEGLNLDFKKSNSISNLNNKIVCKRCEVEIDHKNLNLEENIAYCSNCHSIRSIKRLSKEDEIKKNLGIISPDGITVKNTSTMLYINTNLNVIKGVLTIFGAIFMMFLGYTSTKDETGMYLLYAFSLSIGYYGLINLMNKIHIEVTKNNLKIYSKPLPHFPLKNYNSKSFSQLYVKEYVHKNKNSVSYTYKLRAILKDGKDISLLKLDNSQYTLYLERSIEAWLNIKDRKVSGEYK